MLWVESSGFDALGSMLWVQSSGFNALGSMLWVQSSGFNPLGSMLWVQYYMGSILWVQSYVGSKLRGSILWVQSYVGSMLLTPKNIIAIGFGLSHLATLPVQTLFSPPEMAGNGGLFERGSGSLHAMHRRNLAPCKVRRRGICTASLCQPAETNLEVSY
jgi:hypothetical protein